MSSFDYLATNPDGSDAAGRIEAADSDEARRRLTSQGLVVRELTLIAEPLKTPPRRPLSASESQQFADQLAQFGGTGLPLEAGLRAAAAEVLNPQVAAALNRVASKLGEGISLEAAIDDPECRLPPHVAGLVAAAARTGRLGVALAELLDHQRDARALRRDTFRDFAYPLFVVGVALCVTFVIMFFLTHPFQQMFDDFELELPGPTLMLFWWRDTGIWVLLGSLGVIAAVAAVTRQAIGAAAWSGLISTMPIFGRMSYWTGMAEWTGLLRVLIHHDVALPEALRLSAGGVRNAYVGQIVNSLAQSIDRGKSFSHSLMENRKIPASIVPVIRWGEQTGALSEALSTTHDLLERRVRVRAVMLKSVLPPILFIVIVCQVGGIVFALFMPLVSLIQGLS